MDKLLYLLPCAAMMGAMMWMMRGGHSKAAQPDQDTQAEIAALRHEVAALKTARAGEPADEVTRTP